MAPTATAMNAASGWIPRRPHAGRHGARRRSAQRARSYRCRNRPVPRTRRTSRCRPAASRHQGTERHAGSGWPNRPDGLQRGGGNCGRAARGRHIRDSAVHGARAPRTGRGDDRLRRVQPRRAPLLSARRRLSSRGQNRRGSSAGACAGTTPAHKGSAARRSGFNRASRRAGARSRPVAALSKCQRVRTRPRDGVWIARASTAQSGSFRFA